MERSYGFEGLIFVLLLLSSCSVGPVVSFDSGAKFYVDTASTPQEQADGLMHKEYLPLDQGMIFVFDEEKPRAFWMKNTLIPLDMIFLDDELNVINILTATPCEREPCRLYRSSGPARYVLEINGGLAEKKGIVVGSKMSLTERE